MSEPLRSGQIAAPIKTPRQRFRNQEGLPLPLHVVFWIQIAGAVYSTFNFVARLATFNRSTYLTHARAIAEQKHERIVPDSFVLQGFVMTNVIFAVAILLGIVLAFFVRQGFNWARILLTISICLGLVALLVPPSTDALTYLVNAVDVTALVLVWLPSSNRYFQVVKAARKLHRSRQL